MDYHMLRQQGLSIRKIAALRGVSRNAVRRALRTTAPPTGKRRRAKGVALEPYRTQITSWLSNEVTATWTAERIFDELRDRGYSGGRTVVKEFVRVHRPRKIAPAEARFHVKPGQQLQVDWAEMGVVNIGGIERKLYAFVAIMAWSRALFVYFATDMKLLTWLDCHRRAFEYFGGVPAEVLIDNLKTGVLSRAGGTVRWQPAYESMAVGYSFRPIAHFPMRPKTKGRVERIVRFVRQSFFEGHRSISDLDAFNDQAMLWLARRGNDRVHRVTREKPSDRFEVERKELRELRHYDIVIESTRVADSYGLVSVGGVRYSVPADFARRVVTVHLRSTSTTFLVDGNTIASHRNAPYGVRLVQLKSHLPEAPKPRHERFTQLGAAIADRYGDIGSRYVALVEQRAPHAPLAILREVLARHDEYGSSTVRGVLASLLEFSIVKRGTLSTLCQRFGGTPKLPIGMSPAIPHVDVERRPLAVYDEVAA